MIKKYISIKFVEKFKIVTCIRTENRLKYRNAICKNTESLHGAWPCGKAFSIIRERAKKSGKGGCWSPQWSSAAISIRVSCSGCIIHVSAREYLKKENKKYTPACKCGRHEPPMTPLKSDERNTLRVCEKILFSHLYCCGFRLDYFQTVYAITLF